VFDFNKKRGKKLLISIYEAYVNEEKLFQYRHSTNGSAPQNQYIPKGVKRGSSLHAVFLFFAVLLTYRSQSKVWFRQCKELYEKRPFLFGPDIKNIPLEKVQKHLRESGFIYHQAGGYRWKRSGEGLLKEFGGNPLAIFNSGSIRSIENVLKKVKEGANNLLPGYGPKLLSLLAMLYEEIGAIEHVKGSFPCDVHIQNQCLSLGIVKPNKEIFKNTSFAEFLRKEISELCYSNSIETTLDLSHAMWILGSELCIYCRKKPRLAEYLCPVFGDCNGRIKTELYYKKGRWNLEEKKEILPLFRRKT